MNWLMLVYALFRIDSRTKRWAEDKLKSGDRPVPAFGGNFQFQRTGNKGLAGGRMADQPDRVLLLSTVSGSLLGLNFLIQIFRRGRGLAKVSASLLAAGAAGNLHDRWTRGSVTDFIRLKDGLGPASKIIFNVADVLLLLGGMLLVPARVFTDWKS